MKGTSSFSFSVSSPLLVLSLSAPPPLTHTVSPSLLLTGRAHLLSPFPQSWDVCRANHKLLLHKRRREAHAWLIASKKHLDVIHSLPCTPCSPPTCPQTHLAETWTLLSALFWFTTFLPAAYVSTAEKAVKVFWQWSETGARTLGQDQFMYCWI